MGWRLISIFVAGIALAICGLALSNMLSWPHLPEDFGHYAIVAFLGGLFGATEIAARYPRDPFRAAIQSSALFYVAVNAAAATVAFYAIQLWEPQFLIVWKNMPCGPSIGGCLRNTGATLFLQTFGACATAMILLRTSIFSYKTEGKTIPVGPVFILERLMSAADREVDRALGIQQLEDPDLMVGLNASRVMVDLPLFALSLMDNVSPEEQKEVLDGIAAISEARDKGLTDEVALRWLASALGRFVGPQLVIVAIKSLRAIYQRQNAAGKAHYAQ